ncbi:MAG: DNA-directed RNA polymerase subunit M [Lachnospiraceae bacterium]|nr:DNA-directed RNA polymerase subunit M [Lachnospiraceae bacterium]
MLKIYICPHCFNIRMVSKKPNAVCLHCNQKLVECDIDYTKFTSMDEEERIKYRDRWRKTHEKSLLG